MRSVVDWCAFSMGKERQGGDNHDFFECVPRTGAPPPEWADFAAVVADGVGSSPRPKDAAVAAVRSWMIHAQAKFMENAEECAGFDDVHFNEITAHAFSQAHEAVQSQTKGSSCAASVCLQGDRLMVGNIGDCRVYRITRTGVEQLSEDQVDASGDPTQVIGGKRAPQAYTASEVRVRTGDVTVLCTDGVWKLLSPAEIQQSAAGGSAEQIASRLKHLLSARREPDSDDATAVVAVVKRVGRPFWEIGLKSGDDRLKEDLVETKLNEVLAELLNRLRAPLEKQNARAEQALTQLSTAVEDLRGEVESLRDRAGSIRADQKASGGDWSSMFAVVALSALLLVGGVLLGWTARGRSPVVNTLRVKPQLPQHARILSQQYTNNSLLVYFIGRDNKQRLAIFRLEDGGQPFAIIDVPSESKPDVPVR